MHTHAKSLKVEMVAVAEALRRRPPQLVTVGTISTEVGPVRSADARSCATTRNEQQGPQQPMHTHAKSLKVEMVAVAEALRRRPPQLVTVGTISTEVGPVRSAVSLKRDSISSNSFEITSTTICSRAR